ncbi:unnamed protein product [Rhizopus stolonifer]
MPKPSRLPTLHSAAIESDLLSAIRKKMEQGLLKKKSNSTRIRQTKKMSGTVSALRPAQALTLREGVLVIEAAQLMAAKRGDCVLVVDEDNRLCGIFTAKDLAYRVVADNLDARSTTVSDIMTRNPMCVTSDTSAQDALNLMVSRGFRHLPVCNDDGDIYGLLDITKCIYETLHKMEKAYGSSRKLYDALEGVGREWTNSPIQLVQYMEALKNKMSCPNLTSVLDRTEPVQVSIKTQVREVAKLMKEYHTTAVLVMDRGELTGIFTSKDIVLRVIAGGLAPDNCSVVRVMTPHPDTALPSTSILDALKKMHDGHYLNLPVLDESKNIVGLIDVLRLTYATLEQINSIEGNQGDRFWHSIASDSTENDSVYSDTQTQFHQEPLLSPLPTEPEETPSNSTDSTISSDDNTFSFKFHYANKAHRFRHDMDDFSTLLEIVHQKIKAELPQYADISIAYIDDENDKVLMSCNSDLADSVHAAKKAGFDRVQLFVHHESENPVEKEKSFDYMLPTSLTFLGFVLVFTLSKLTRK